MNAPTFTDAEIAERLDPSKTSLDHLYRELANGLPGFDGFGTDAVAKGKAALRTLNGRLRRELCPRLNDPAVRRYIDGANSGDAISLVAVLASLISSMGLALNSVLVAILLVRMGIRTLCPGV